MIAIGVVMALEQLGLATRGRADGLRHHVRRADARGRDRVRARRTRRRQAADRTAVEASKERATRTPRRTCNRRPAASTRCHFLVRAACCCIRRRCRDASASAISGRARSRSSICSQPPVSGSGRCCRSGPTGYGDSPYQSFSAFAGNPLLISLDALDRRGTAEAVGRRRRRRFRRRQRRLRARHRSSTRDLAARPGAVRRAVQPAVRDRFDRFCTQPGALAGRLRVVHGGQGRARPGRVDRVGAGHRRARSGGRGAVVDAPRARDPDSTSSRSSVLRPVGAPARRTAARDRSTSSAIFPSSSRTTAPTSGRGASCSGSTPTASRRSSPACRPTTSARPVSCGETRTTTGRCSRKTGYAWWIDRVRTLLTLVDRMRLDHFRGFVASWEVAERRDDGRAR